MTEVLSNNTTDKVAALVKEAESLKAKLEEERQKLNDVTRKFFFLILQLCTVIRTHIRTWHCYHFKLVKNIKSLSDHLITNTLSIMKVV